MPLYIEIYRCALCRQTALLREPEQVEFPEDAEAKIVEKVDSKNFGIIHYCDDGSIGFAYLAGYQKGT